MRVLFQHHVQIILKQNSHVISLLSNKFDAKHDTIKTEKGERLLSRNIFEFLFLKLNKSLYVLHLFFLLIKSEFLLTESHVPYENY